MNFILLPDSWWRESTILLFVIRKTIKTKKFKINKLRGTRACYYVLLELLYSGFQFKVTYDEILDGTYAARLMKTMS